jgi:hypothetical protein
LQLCGGALLSLHSQGGRELAGGEVRTEPGSISRGTSGARQSRRVEALVVAGLECAARSRPLQRQAPLHALSARAAPPAGARRGGAGTTRLRPVPESQSLRPAGATATTAVCPEHVAGWSGSTPQCLRQYRADEHGGSVPLRPGLAPARRRSRTGDNSWVPGRQPVTG